MLCQHCGKNEATRHYHVTANNETQETHLCAACAAATGFDAEFQKTFPAAAVFPSFAFGLPAAMSDMLGPRAPRADGGVCPTCGTRLAELSKTGKVGCADCYDVFAPALTPYIRRLHGEAKHTGRLPGGAAPEIARRREMDSLRQQLQDAIGEQAFERAAELRDEIARRQKGEEPA